MTRRTARSPTAPSPAPSTPSPRATRRRSSSRARPAPRIAATLVNTATVSGVQRRPSDSHSQHAPTIWVYCPTVVITKTADDTDIVAGDPIGFTITITNTGAGTAFGVTASDPLPAGLDWVDRPGQPRLDHRRRRPLVRTGDARPRPGRLDLGPHHGRHLTARTAAPSRTPSRSPTSAAAARTTSDVTVRCPSVDLDKTTTDSDGKVEPNQTVSYGITVSVTDGPVTNAVVTDTCPSGRPTSRTASRPRRPRPRSRSPPDGRTLTWTYATLPSGDGCRLDRATT